MKKNNNKAYETKNELWFEKQINKKSGVRSKSFWNTYEVRIDKLCRNCKDLTESEKEIAHLCFAETLTSYNPKTIQFCTCICSKVILPYTKKEV